MAETPPQDSEFEVTTTVQVERTYRVKAKDADATHQRLRRYLADPEMAAPGMVEKIGESDVRGEQVKTETIKEVTGPRAVTHSAAAS